MLVEKLPDSSQHGIELPRCTHGRVVSPDRPRLRPRPIRRALPDRPFGSTAAACARIGDSFVLPPAVVAAGPPGFRPGCRAALFRSCPPGTAFGSRLLLHFAAQGTPAARS
jgi:hypothetical protein